MAISDFERRQAYHHIFGTPMGGIVLVDLFEYCNYNATTIGMPHEEGKRDVYLHILEMWKNWTSEDYVHAMQGMPNRNIEVQSEADF